MDHTPIQNSHLYSVYFAPRGNVRMANLGMQVAQQYLSAFDRLIGVIGEAGSGKSMLIKGMFPSLELTSDDEGVNVRPLPILNIDYGSFFSPHTYHLDVRFESAFTQMHVLATAVGDAIEHGKRVIVEHFDLLYPFLKRNAELLIGVGEEVIITRPNIFGPEPQDIADIVFHSVKYRKMTHTAEEICQYVGLEGFEKKCFHGDVRHGFVLGYQEQPEFDPKLLEQKVREIIAQDLPVSFIDETHIEIGSKQQRCTGPRMHVHSTGEITHFAIIDHFIFDPVSKLYLLVGLVGEQADSSLSDLNRFIL